MKQRKSMIIWVVTSVLITGLAVFQMTAMAQPGAVIDPVVTQRYVDERIAVLEGRIASLQAAMENIQPCQCAPGGGTAAPGTNCSCPPQAFACQCAPGTAGNNVSGQSPFVPLNVEAGRRIVFGAGAEIILRAGAATVFSGPNGLVNVTTGIDLGNGTSVPGNNLLLVPATDGRGLHFTQNSWLMIRGEHTFVN